MKVPYGLLAILLLSASIPAISANNDPTLPSISLPRLIGLAGAPAFSNSTICNPTLNGAMTITYPDGSPVIVNQTEVDLRVCGSTGGCVLITGNITSNGQGVYIFLYKLPPEVSGEVQVIIPAGSLTDSHGASFPNSDVVVATFTELSQPTCSAQASTPTMRSSNPDVMRQGLPQPVNQNTLSQTNLLVLAVLAVLTIAGVVLVAAPRKSH